LLAGFVPKEGEVKSGEQPGLEPVGEVGKDVGEVGEFV